MADSINDRAGKLADSLNPFSGLLDVAGLGLGVIPPEEEPQTPLDVARMGLGITPSSAAAATGQGMPGVVAPDAAPTAAPANAPEPIAIAPDAIAARQTGGAAEIPEVKDQRPLLTQLAEPPVLFAAGALQGILEDPLLNFVSPTHMIWNEVVATMGAPDTSELGAHIERFTGSRDSNFDNIGKFVGEFAPSMIAGSGLFVLGRAALVKALRINAGRIAEKVSEGKLKQQLGGVVAREASLKGIGNAEVAKVGLERGAEIAGGALGFGVAGALESAARDEDPLIGGLIGAALSGATEAAFIGGARVLGRGREIVGSKVFDRFVGSTEDAAASVKDRIASGTQAQKSKLLKANERVEKATDALEQQQSIVESFRATPGGVRSSAAKQILDEEEALEGTLLVAQEEAREGFRAAAKEFREFRGGVRATRSFIDRKAPVVSQYTTDTPYRPDATRLWLASVYLNLLQTPEGALKKMGVTGVRLLNTTLAAEHEYAVARAVTAAMVDEIRKTSARAMGVKGAAARNGKFLRPVVEAYERGGLDGVHRYLTMPSVAGRKFNALDEASAQEMVLAFQKIGELKTRYDKLARLGAQLPFKPEELEKLGVKAFFPHVMDLGEYSAKKEAQVIASLVKHGKTEAEAREIVAQSFSPSAETRKGFLLFGGQEHRRKVAGTLEEKLASGIPHVDDPLAALEIYSLEMDRALAYGKRFGYSQEARAATKNALLDMAEAEGASRPLMNTIADHIMNVKYYDQTRRRIAQSITSLETAAKLTFAVIPNMSQSVNTIMFTGFRNYVNGLKALTDKSTRAHVEHNLALYESLFQSLRRSYRGQSLPENIFDKFADFTLRASGFSTVERFNRLAGGMAGYQMILDKSAKALTGRLRGETLAATRRKFRALGLEIDDLAKNQKMFDDGASLTEVLKRTYGDKVDEAVFNAAKLTQFIPDITKRPPLWMTPEGRIFTQFKSFSLNQGKFIRDQVLNEVALGNVKPLAYFLSIYPLAGDVVRQVQAKAKGKERKIRGPQLSPGVDRFMDDITALGTLGLTHSFVQSLKYGDPGGFFAGPAGSDALAGFEGAYDVLFEQNPGKLKRTVTRQPVYQAAKQLYSLPHQFFKKDAENYANVNSVKGGTNKGASAVPIEELFRTTTGK